MSLRSFLAGTAVLAVASLGACVPPPEPTPAPAPAPALAPAPRPTPAPAPPPFDGNWMDAPLTPGDWRYAGGTATFAGPDGSALLTLRCAGRTVIIDRAGVGNEFAPSLVLRSEAASRTLDAVQVTGGSTGPGLGKGRRRWGPSLRISIDCAAVADGLESAAWRSPKFAGSASSSKRSEPRRSSGGDAMACAGCRLR